MYIFALGGEEWQFVPRDDAPDRWFGLPSGAGRTLSARIGQVDVGPLRVSASGPYRMVTLQDTVDQPLLRVVGRFGRLDPLGDRHVLDSIGAHAVPDPPGSPWAVFSCRSGLIAREALTDVAAIMYGIAAQIKGDLPV